MVVANLPLSSTYTLLMSLTHGGLSFGKEAILVPEVNDSCLVRTELICLYGIHKI